MFVLSLVHSIHMSNYLESLLVVRVLSRKSSSYFVVVEGVFKGGLVLRGVGPVGHRTEDGIQ